MIPLVDGAIDRDPQFATTAARSYAQDRQAEGRRMSVADAIQRPQSESQAL
jgi:hypothetical protein